MRHRSRADSEHYREVLTMDRSRIVTLTLLLSLVSQLNAATLVFQTDTTLFTPRSLLFGATGVIVDGRSFDVEFRRGSCNSFFAGCSQFAFPHGFDAYLANIALRDQVFTSSSGTLSVYPRDIHGCDPGQDPDETFCTLFTPFSASITPTSFDVLASAIHLATSSAFYPPQFAPDELCKGHNFFIGGVGNRHVQLPANMELTYVVWTNNPPSPVAEPRMLGLALVLLPWILRRRGSPRIQLQLL